MDGDAKWSVESYAIHNEEMRLLEGKLQDEKFKHLAEVIELNDKRYTEGNELRAMALKIKETADANALELASEAQTYKEARNDAMREQNLKDNGVYATRDDLASAIQDIRKVLQPVVDYVSSAQGATKGGQITMGNVYAAIGATGTIVAIIMLLIK